MIGLRFARLDELIDLAQGGEVVPRPRGHGAPAPLDTRPPYGHRTDRHEPAAFLLVVCAHRTPNLGAAQA